MKNYYQSRLLIWLLFALAIPFTGIAQKANTKLVAVKYVQPPSKPLEDHIKTYYVNIINEAAGLSVSTEQSKDAIALQGFGRAATQADADLLIELTVNSVSSEGSVKKVTYKKKINDSTYVDKTGGAWEVNSFMNVNYFVKDLKSGQNITKGSKSHSQKFESERYNTYNDAVYASNEKKAAKGRDMYKELFIKAVSDLNSLVNNQYGYPVKSSWMPIARGKGKKHDYSDLEEAYNKFVQATELSNAGSGNDNVSKLLKECVFTWESAAKEYDDNKKARISPKNIGEINYNIAVAKMLLGDFSGAKNALESAKEAKANQSSVSALESITDELEKRHEINQ